MAAASNTTPPKTLTYLESLYPLGLCDLSFNEPTTPTMGRHSDRHGRRHDRPSDFPPGRRQTAPVDQYGNWQHEEEDPYQDHADMAADHADQYYATYGSYQGQEPASGPYASPRTWPDYDLYDDHNGQYGQDTYTSGSMTPRAGR